jgi:hypothetical protein
MSVPLGRTARRWTLILLLAVFASLVAIAWTAITPHPPIEETSQLPDDADRLPTAVAPVIAPVQTQIQPATKMPSQANVGSQDLQPETIPAVSGGHKIVAQPTADLGRDDSLDIKLELAKGLQNLMAWSRSRVDAGHPGAD